MPSLHTLKVMELYDAQHPYRQAAIRIIEDIIETKLQRPIEGIEYYNLEDYIVDAIDCEMRKFLE